MIPLKLELTNFLSYRDTTVLDLTGIHLACISGLNGAGKSSILDGITWALFGRSRSKSDDDLVNRLAALLGYEAQVMLQFSLERNVYRIRRQKESGGRAVLELHMGTGQDQWKTLSEGGIRETQAAIERLLRMNYETFINASFLLQGKADEFTTKSPGRRKEILIELLGVSEWDRYKEAASSRRKEAELQLALLDNQVSEIEQELAEEPERQAAVQRAREGLEAVEARLGDKEALLQQLRRAQAAVEQQRQLLKNFADNLARAREQLVDLQRNRQRRQEEKEEYQSVVAESDEIVAQFDTWQRLDDRVRSWQTQAEEYNRLQLAKQPHEVAIAQASSRLEQRVRELEAQEHRTSQVQQERQTVERELLTAKEHLAQNKISLTNLSQQEREWRRSQSELQQLESERRLLAQELEQLKKEADRVEMALKDKSVVAANAGEAEKHLADLESRVAALTEQNQQLQTGRAELDTLEKDQPRLREQMNELRANLDQLDVETGGQCPLCGQPLSDEHRRSVMAKLQVEGEELRDRYRAAESRIEMLRAEVARLSESLKQMPRLERDQRAQQQRKATADARLGEIDRIVLAWQEEGNDVRLKELELALDEDEAVLKLRQQVATLESAVKEKATLEGERQALQMRVSEANARLTEIERIVAEWQESGVTALAATKQQLERFEYAHEAQAALREIETKIEALAYDAEAHQETRRNRDELAQVPERHQELRQALAAVKPLEETLADLDGRISDQEQTIAELSHQYNAAESQLDQQAADGGDLRLVEDDVFRLREEKTAADRQLGAAEQRLEVLDNLRDRRKQLATERVSATQLIRRLKLLEQACGRNGVQALLIEQALPEIEERANELLERLTGGDMRVTFETQRKLKTRDALAETLDIRIVDSAGERPYANFSGGEQFRVNFAIRLALSQTLAKRAGARLQTLVIDEGFGSQDPSGRQRLVEAINTIQDDFARILVITHIEELRDAFPTRIEVEKTLEGSTISVI